MNIIYVLRSFKDGNLYVGCTSDIERRLSDHREGRVRSTKSRRPFSLIYKEEFTNKYEAFKKEKYYKTVKGKRELKNKISRNCGVV